MQVVLREDVDGLGKKGDVLDVKNGYGRNFLLPNGKAFAATKGALDQAAAMRRSRDLRESKDKESAQTVADALAGKVIRIDARAGAEGKLFGSVTNVDVVEAIAAQAGAQIEKKRVSLDEPIRSVGEYKATVKLHSEIEVQVSLEVVSSGA